MPRQGLDSRQVLDAAIVLADEGLERVTFARLAEQLGVRPPSLYNHIDGRAALMGLITLRGLNELADVLAAAAAGLAGADALRATAHAYRAYALTHPGTYEATLVAPRITEPEIEAAAQRLIDLLSSILRGWQLDGEHAIDAIRIIRSALHGFVTLERSGGFKMARHTDATFERLIDMLAAGLAAPTGTGERSAGL